MAPTCKRQIVSGNQRSQLVFAVQSRDQFKNQLAGASIEIAGRLIGQQDSGLGDERTRQRNTLLFAAGKFAGAMMPARLKPDFAQPPRSFVFRFG